MRFLIIAATSVALLSTSAAVPYAQAQSSSQALPVSGAGNDKPGGLSARDVVGKRLSNADGDVLGQIVSVSADGANATVRPAEGGAPTIVSMDQLSLGTGARQVILGGEPNAPPPHYSSQSTSITSTTTPPTVVVVPPPQ
jgi:hypothetical protein